MDGGGSAYIDMSSPTPAVSNPVYFSDVIAGDVTTGAPQAAVSGPGSSADPREQSPHDNYYNCPPPLQPSANSMWAAPVSRQTSQV